MLEHEIMKLLRLIFVCILLVACQPTSQDKVPQLPPDLKIVLERGACHGACPVYSVTIHPGGRVSFQGTSQGLGFSSVPVLPSAIGPDQLQQVVTAIEASHFFALPISGQIAMGAPTATTTITMNGQNKSVSHIGFDCTLEYNSTSPTLCDLENLIDEVTGAKQWANRE